jgi:hypothetical protein
MMTKDQIEDVLEHIYNKEVDANGDVLGLYKTPMAAFRALGYIDHKGNWTGKAGLRSERDFHLSLHAQREIAREYLRFVDEYLQDISMYDKHVGTFFGNTLITSEGLLQAAYLLDVNRLYWGLQDPKNVAILEYISYQPYEYTEHTGPSYPEEL